MNGSKPIILIADDDPGIRTLMSRFMHDGGFASIEAVDGQEALELFRSDKPDLVLTDLHMPVMDGMALLKKIVEESPLTPVIIISGVGTLVDSIEAIRFGAWDYLLKPLQDKAFILHSVEKALERAALLIREKERQDYLEQQIALRTAEIEKRNEELEQEIKRRRSQEELVIYAKKEWERLVDAMPDLIAIVDRNNKFVRMNKSMANKLGLDFRTIVGMDCFFSVHNCQSPPDFCPHAMMMADGKTRTIEIYEKHLGGYYELTVIPYLDPDGTLIGSVHVARDINERKKNEKEKDKLKSELLHAQKLEAVGQLASGIAHEINTPTQYVGTNIDFLSDAFQDVNDLMGHFQTLLEAARKHDALTEQVRQVENSLEEVDWQYLAEEIPTAIKQSQDGVKRVSSIVQSMKEFSHPGSKEKVDADLNRIIETTVNVARNEWKYVADLKTDLDPNLPPVSCLTDEMGQVILNMVVNAAHAIAEKQRQTGDEEKGLIFISTSFDDASVEMRIADSGTGIPVHARDRVFDPFYTTKKVGKGTGQGLAITHDVIAGKHGGLIAFDTQEGQGTTFVIKLPRSTK